MCININYITSNKKNMDILAIPPKRGEFMKTQISWKFGLSPEWNNPDFGGVDVLGTVQWFPR